MLQETVINDRLMMHNNAIKTEFHLTLASIVESLYSHFSLDVKQG